MPLNFRFANLNFAVDRSGHVFLDGGFFIRPGLTNTHSHFTEIQILGNDRKKDGSFKQNCMSEYYTLRYVSHQSKDNTLRVKQKNDQIEAVTVFETFSGTNAVRIHNEIRNISKKDLILTHANCFELYGFGGGGEELSQSLFFHDFPNCQHTECQARRRSFRDCGISGSFSSFRFANIGSWSTKTKIPQGILEDAESKSYLMFQIESNHDWYYEVGLDQGLYYLNLSGGTGWYHQWERMLRKGETYRTPNAVLACGHSLNEVLAEMTIYRRNNLPQCPSDANLPVIFNEYMHLNWDSPSESFTAEMASEAAAFGVDCYVIDCGWHDEADVSRIYDHVGIWKGSRARFPGGIAGTTEIIHRNGMKAGLWLEPEVVGCLCKGTKDIYGEDCFLQRHGKRVYEMGRCFLDFRNERVRRYLNTVIDRIVVDYGADYIKFDYNQDCGPGTDLDCISPGEGLELHMQAYSDWVKSIRKKYPDLILEGCASGGMRLDPVTLSMFSPVSTSDQTDYRLYPYIVANIFTAVLPEQAGVWNYPVCSSSDGAADIDSEAVAMNTVNALLGRMYLSSNLKLLNAENRELVKEGIAYYRLLTPEKKRAVPYLPVGYASFGDAYASVGLRAGKMLYLAIWNLSEPRTVMIPLTDVTVKSAKVGYPARLPTCFEFEPHRLTVRFTEKAQARLFEIELE